MSKQSMLLGAVAVVSLAAGGAGGYLFAKRRLEEEMEARFQADLEVAKNFYANVTKPEFPTPADAVKKLIPEDQTERTNKAAGALRVYQGGHTGEAAQVVKDIVEGPTNVFDRDPPQDPGPEKLEPGYPRVIDEDTYMENATNYVQVTLTYFVGDRILVDDRDEPVDLRHQIVGESNLELFHDAPHMTTMYVRNEKQQVDYEIVRSEGKYAVEVAGFTE